jgi:hypothetical protein
MLDSFKPLWYPFAEGRSVVRNLTGHLRTAEDNKAQKPNRTQKELNMRRLLPTLLILMTICGLFAWAQQNRQETSDTADLTLADLGVTEAQKEQLKALWELKRQKHIQAVAALKTLNRLAKDSIAPEKEIQEILENVRQNRQKQTQQIQATEDELIKTLPPHAQLHLTILGILDNGLTPRRAATLLQKGGKEDDDNKQGKGQGAAEGEVEKQK